MPGLYEQLNNSKDSDYDDDGFYNPKNMIIDEEEEEEKKQKEDKTNDPSNKQNFDPNDQGNQNDQNDQNDEPLEEEEKEEANLSDNALKEIEELKREKAQLLEILKQKIPTDSKQTVQESAKETKIDVYNDTSFKGLTDLLNVDEKDKGILVNFFKTFEQNIKQKSTEEALKSLPDVVAQLVSSQYKNMETVDSFYKEHPKLNNPYIKKMVGAIAEEVESEGSLYSAKDKFDEIAKRAYATLGIQKETKRKPAFSNPQKNVRKTKIEKTKMQSELDAMLKGV